ncbi:MAG TPA: NAD(P)H-binding protein [Solirubrobacteraceae bacterium]|nr:NAD(P)H-binding protein [Solirubrobacteraceae bacterium]
MRILITGPSGAVGEALARSLSGGSEHELRALAREPARVAGELPVELIRGDALTGEGLERALDGVEVAYYLIHSMEPAALPGFAERDRVAAQRFAAAASAAGVRRIVYLGGLRSGQAAVASAHLVSRGEVERILLDAVPDSVALRASLVIGARSRSFRALVRLIERLPVVPLPPWRRYRTQPIDERDAIAYLTAAAAAAGVGGSAFDIGGPEVLSYGVMIERITALLMLARPTVRVPDGPGGIISALAARVSGVPRELLGPLMGSLGGDLLADDAPARAAFAVPLHGFDAAVEHALRDWEALEPLRGR